MGIERKRDINISLKAESKECEGRSNKPIGNE